MKKAFSRWIQALTTATSETSTKKRSKGGKKSSAPQSKKLALECLEDRCLLSITFNPLQEFVYKPSETSSISFGLERTHFLEIAKMTPGTGSARDIVSIDQSSHTVSVFMNQGGSNYSAPKTTVITGPGLGDNSAFALADMDGDGVSDLLVFYSTLVNLGGGATRTDLVVDVYTGNPQGNGTFAPTPKRTPITNPFNLPGVDNYVVIENVQVRNFMGDGHPDLLITLTGVYFEGSVKKEKTESFVYVGQKDGFAATKYTVPSSVSGNAVGFANLTSSTSSWQLVSQSEVVAGKNTIPTLHFYNNVNFTSNPLTMSAAGQHVCPTATTFWTKIANVDGTVGDEIISGIHYLDNNNDLQYAIQVSSMTAKDLPSTAAATAPLSSRLINVDIDPRYFAIGNLSGHTNGLVDILISDGTSYQILVGTGNSNKPFNVQNKIDSFANYLAVQAGDFTGDGYQDIVAIGEKHVMFLPGNPADPDHGKGRIIVDFTAKVTNAVFADFTGDGYLDFVVAQGDAGTTLTLYRGLAPGNLAGGKPVIFEKLTTIPGAISPSVLAAGNFITPKTPGAKTPKSDLAVLHAGASGIMDNILVVSFNNSGIVGKPQDTRLTASAVHFAAGDFNNDGYDDIITVNETSARATVWLNKKDGTFDNVNLFWSDLVGAPVTQQGGSRPSVVAVADINGDGRLDFAVLNAGDGEARFYTQNTAGPFGFSPNSATPVIGNLNLKGSVRNYQMIFEDFDRDGRVDLLIGVTGANNAMIFRNEGLGQFSSAPIWVGTGLTLDGSLNNRTVFAISTGFKTGHENSASYASKTPGIVLVSGNMIYRFENTTPSQVSPGSMEIVFREYKGTTVPMDSGQYDKDKIPSTITNPSLTWLHEWGHYYLEVWGSTGSAENISNFTCIISYKPSLFSVIDTYIEPVSANFELTKRNVNVNAGLITVEGNSKSDVLGRNQYVLLFRVYVTPTSRNGVSLPANGGLATPISSEFRFNTSQINSKNLVNLKDGQMMPVYPVIYDLDDSGTINPLDFTEFAKAFRTRHSSTPDFRIDFNADGVITALDFTEFAKAFRQRNAPYFLHSFFPSNFPRDWPQLTVQSSAVMMAMSAPLEVSAAFSTVPNEDFLEPVVQGEETAFAITELLNNYSCSTADIITAESDSVDIKSSRLSLNTASPFEFVAAASLSISELDTFGYVARTESVFNSERKRIETFDQVFGDLFQDDDEVLTLEEIAYITEQPFDSLRLNEKILAELI